MRTAVVHMISDWAKGAQFGVNPYIPKVPRVPGDPVPPLLATHDGAAAIFDETRHLWVVEKKPPPVAGASIYVMTELPIELAGMPTPDGQVRDTESPMVVSARYLVQDSDSIRRVRNGEYTLRAMLRSIRELLSNANAASRVLADIALIEIQTATYIPMDETVGNFTAAGALVLGLAVRDCNPSFT